MVDERYINQKLKGTDPNKNDFKHRICDIFVINSNTVLKAKIEIITIVDLITTVAGVPGLLLLISSKLLHKFEAFYTDLQIYKSFFEE